MDKEYEDFRCVCKVSFLPLSNRTLWNPSKDKKKGKVEYVWIDHSKTIKSKTLMMSGCIDEISELPLEEHLSTYVLRPVAIFDDISENESNVLVLCMMDEMHSLISGHHPEKKRETYRKIMLSEQIMKEDLRFEIEQEFIFKQCVDMKNFSMGKARKVIEAFCQACFNALIPIHSVTYKSSHNECWSYKIGPCMGHQTGDILWMSRYVLKRISEDLDLTVTFEPLNTIASGDYLPEEFRPSTRYQFSTDRMREMDVTPHIDTAFDKLMKGSEHRANIEDFYGKDCQHSMSLVRMPDSVQKNGRGNLEDGRPAGYSDPYDVISYIVKTCFL